MMKSRTLMLFCQIAYLGMLFLGGFVTARGVFLKGNEEALSEAPRQQPPIEIPLADRLFNEKPITNAYERYFQLAEAMDRNPGLAWQAFNHYGLYDGFGAEKLMNQFIQRDPFTAFEQIWRTPGRSRLYFLSNCVAVAFQQDIDQGFQLLEKVSHFEITTLPSLQDIHEHVDRVEKMPPGLYKSHFIKEVAEGWQESDSAAALEWASKLPPELQVDAFKGLFDSWLKNGWDEEGMAFFDREIHGRLRTNIAAQWVSQIARNDPDQALEWVDRYMSGSGRENMKNIVVETTAKDNPELAAKYIEAFEDDQEGYRAIAGFRVLNEWVSQDASAAAEWVIGLPESDFPEREGWLVELSRDWFDKDSEGVKAYIEHAEDVPVHFVERVGQFYWRADPVTAHSWVDTLPEPYRTPVRETVENLSSR